MARFALVITVVELIRDQEMGLNFIPTIDMVAVINLDKVESYKQDCDDNGDLNNYTRVDMESGSTHCVRMPFEEFNKLMLNND